MDYTSHRLMKLWQCGATALRQNKSLLEIRIRHDCIIFIIYAHGSITT
jgi:hypothetical protein